MAKVSLYTAEGGQIADIDVPGDVNLPEVIQYGGNSFVWQPRSQKYLMATVWTSRQHPSVDIEPDEIVQTNQAVRAHEEPLVDDEPDSPRFPELLRPRVS